MNPRVFGSAWLWAPVLIVAGAAVGFAAAPNPANPLVVDTTADTSDVDVSDGVCADLDGRCSLRAALQTAGASARLDHIHFSIPDTDSGFDPVSVMSVISLDTSLPEVDDAVVVDGATDPRFAEVNRPVITIDAGSLATPAISLESPGSTLSDLVIIGGSVGVYIGAANTRIERSVVGGADGAGLHLVKAGGTAIIGNWIGVDWNGNPLANNGPGIDIDRQSSNSAIVNNVIGSNVGPGVGLRRNALSDHAIVGNVISGNGGLAIDLGADGVTVNDLDDGDPGPNDFLNHPTLVQAISSETETRMLLELPLPPGHYQLDVYQTAAPDPSGHGELDEPFTSTTVSVDTYDQTLNVIAAPELRVDRYVTAIITECVDPSCADHGSTSEAAFNRLIEINLLPIIESGNVVSPVEVPVVVPLQGSDPEGGELTWSATGLPPGIGLDGETLAGAIEPQAAGQSFEVQVTAVDDVGNSATSSFTWTVTGPPTTTSTTTTSTTAPTTTTPTTIVPTTSTTEAPTTTMTSTTVTSTTEPTTTTTATEQTTTTAEPTTTTTQPTTTSESTTTVAPTTTTPTTVPPTVDADTSGPSAEPPAELAATSRAELEAGAALRNAAVELLRTPVDDAAATDRAVAPKASLLVVLDGLSDLVKAAEPPTRPLLYSFLLSCFVWLVMRLATSRTAFMVGPDADDVSVTGYRLRAGSGPYWGRRKWLARSVVSLETPYGKGAVPSGKLIELEADLSELDHFR